MVLEKFYKPDEEVDTASLIGLTYGNAILERLMAQLMRTKIWAAFLRGCFVRCKERLLALLIVQLVGKVHRTAFWDKVKNCFWRLN